MRDHMLWITPWQPFKAEHVRNGLSILGFISIATKGFIEIKCLLFEFRSSPHMLFSLGLQTADTKQKGHGHSQVQILYVHRNGECCAVSFNLDSKPNGWSSICKNPFQCKHHSTVSRIKKAYCGAFSCVGPWSCKRYMSTIFHKILQRPFAYWLYTF